MTGEPRPPKKKRWSWWKTLLLILVLLIVGLGVGRWQWGRHADKVLQAEIDAIRARGEPLAWRELKPKPIPDEENAAELYREAWTIALLDPKLARDPDERRRLERLASMVASLAEHPEFRREHAEEARQILALSAGALALCREARVLEKADWKTDFRGPALMTTIPSLGRQRELAKLLCLAAVTANDADDAAAAIEYIRDAIAVGEAGGKTPFLASALVHMAMDALTTAHVEDIAPALRVGGDRGATAEQVRKLIAELLDEGPLRQSMLRAFIGERACQYDTCERYRRGRPGVDLGVPSGRLFTTAFQPMLKIDEVRLLRYMTGYVDAMREKTYPAAAARLPVYEPPKSKLEMFTKLLSSELTMSVDRSVALCYRQLATRKMAAVALAIRLYEIDTGRRPEKLSDLVGKYLPALPTDPFAADARPLGYLPKAEKPRLYSINNDGKDDGGKFALYSGGYVSREVLDLVFFLNEGDRPREPCEWEDPASQPGATTRPASMPATFPGALRPVPQPPSGGSSP